MFHLFVIKYTTIIIIIVEYITKFIVIICTCLKQIITIVIDNYISSKQNKKITTNVINQLRSRFIYDTQLLIDK